MNLISSLNKKWMFGVIGCQIDGFFGGIFGIASIITIMFMTIERYIVIHNPFTNLVYSKKFTFSIISVTWIYSMFWMCLVVSHKGFYLEGLLISCTFDYLNRDFITRMIMISLFFAGFIIPLLVIIIFYFLIWYSLKKDNFDKFFYSPNTSSMNSSRHLVIDLQTSNSRKDKKQNYKLYIKKEVSVVNRILIMVISFCIAWLPYSIVLLYAQFSHNIQYLNAYSTSLPAVFAKTSCIYNPIIYVLTNVECKRFFTRSFLKKLNQNTLNNNNQIRVKSFNKKSVQV